MPPLTGLSGNRQAGFFIFTELLSPHCGLSSPYSPGQRGTSFLLSSAFLYFPCISTCSIQ